MRRAWTVLALLALAAGCRSAYDAERALWKADKLKRSIAASPENVPPKMFRRAQQSYEEVASRFPGTPQAVSARLGVGEVLALENKFAEAEAVFRGMLSEHPDKERVVYQSELALAALKEKQGLWDEARALYWAVARKFDAVPQSLSLPLHVAHQDANRGRPDEGYAEALRHYEDLVKKYPKSPIALGALESQLQVYGETRRLPEAIRVLQEIQDGFPGTPEAARAAQAKDHLLKAPPAAPPPSDPKS